MVAIARGDVLSVNQEQILLAQELNNQANKYFDSGRYAEGIAFAKRAVAIREQLLGPDDLETAASLHSLGRLLRQSGNYRQAEKALQRALDIREKTLGPEHLILAESLNNLGILYYNTGYYTRAETLYQRALAIREKTLGKDHTDTAKALNNLALLYSETGNYVRSEQLYRRVLEIRERVLGLEHPDTARASSNLALLYMTTGAYSQAEPLFIHAIEIKERVLGAEHPDTANSINNLAVLYAETGRNIQAGQLFKRTLAIREKTLGLAHPETAAAMGNLAETLISAGSSTEATLMLKRALAIQEKALGPNSPYAPPILNNLAELHRSHGEYAQAEALIRQSLAIYEKSVGPEHPSTALTISSLATVKWAESQSSQALALLQRAQSIQGRNVERFLISGSETRKRKYLQALATNTYQYVSFSVAVHGNDSVALGLNGVLQYKGRALDSVSDSMTRLRHSLGIDDQKVLEQLGQVADEFSNLVYKPDTNVASAARLKQLDSLTRQQERLEVELSRRSNEFRMHVMPVTIAAVRNATPKDAVVIEWIKYKSLDPRTPKVQSAYDSDSNSERYAAFVIKRNEDPTVIDLGDAQAIDSAVQQFRRSVSDPKDDDYKLQAASLFTRVIEPLSKHIKGFSHLLLSPDGNLNLVPMGALLNSRGEYLIEQFDITYLTSARDLLRIQKKLAPSSGDVVVADPFYGSRTAAISQLDATIQSQRSSDLDRGGLVFRSLSNTALEAQALKKLLKLDDANVLLQLDATETRLKQLRGPRILHVATHGFFLGDQDVMADLNYVGSPSKSAILTENPLLRSGIALTGANVRRAGPGDDGILTALEAANLDLHGTELVVLSACDSGIGNVQNGEGVYGLRRALVLAGAQTQITSLWKVSDEATRVLMIDYYQRLLNGVGRSAALRQAQLSMLANKDLSHPYYWASFVPIGNWAPLSPQH